jgi:hypothetical protein
MELLQEVFLAKTSVLQDAVLDLQETDQDSFGKSADSLTKPKRSISSWKMSQDYFPQVTEQTWEQSSQRWHNAGMGSLTGFLTLNILEYPNAAVECSLSEVLETTGEHLRKYSLSQKAAQGILRRAEKREKVLPPLLMQALLSVAEKM